MLAPLVSAHLQLTARLTSPPLPGPLEWLHAALPGPSPSPSLAPIHAPATSNPGLGAFADGLRNTLGGDPTTTLTCTKDDVSVCGVVFKITGNKELGQVLDVVLGTPLRLLLIIVLGVLLRRTLHRVIHRLAERIATGPASNGGPVSDRRRRNGLGRFRGGRTRGGQIDLAPPLPPVPPMNTGQVGTGPGGTGLGRPLIGTSPLLTTRRQARARTLASVLRSVTTAVIGVVVVLMVLQELDFSVAPLLASAGVVGVALGLGAQSLVRDVVAGMFMIVEDQYGVGDVVDVGAASGAVEAVGLRVTRLRDVNGTVWYVRNGEIMRVGNQSQGWSRSVLDVNVGYSEDLDEVEQALLETARALRTDARFGPLVLEDPEVWGVEALTADGVVMRLVVKTQPQQQWTVSRELRRRIKQRFDADGIEMRPMPRTVLVNEDEDDAPSADAADSLEQ